MKALTRKEIIKTIPGLHTPHGHRLVDVLFPEEPTLDQLVNLEGLLGEYISSALGKFLECQQIDNEGDVTDTTKYKWGDAIYTVDKFNWSVKSISWPDGEFVRHLTKNTEGREYGTVMYTNTSTIYKERKLALDPDTDSLYLELLERGNAKSNWDESFFVNINDPSDIRGGVAVGSVVNFKNEKAYYLDFKRFTVKEDGIYLPNIHAFNKDVLIFKMKKEK
jgi:hypothetical protein